MVRGFSVGSTVTGPAALLRCLLLPLLLLATSSNTDTGSLVGLDNKPDADDNSVNNGSYDDVTFANKFLASRRQLVYSPLSLQEQVVARCFSSTGEPDTGATCVGPTSSGQGVQTQGTNWNVERRNPNIVYLSLNDGIIPDGSEYRVRFTLKASSWSTNPIHTATLFSIPNMVQIDAKDWSSAVKTHCGGDDKTTLNYMLDVTKQGWYLYCQGEVLPGNRVQNPDFNVATTSQLLYHQGRSFNLGYTYGIASVFFGWHSSLTDGSSYCRFTGSWSNVVVSLLKPPVTCSSSNGTVTNNGNCKCGTSNCDVSSGLYCISSLNFCGKTCPALGEYRSGATNGVCTKCPGGSYSDDASDMSRCKPCSAGKWSDQEGLTAGSQCSACSAGKWSDQAGLTADSQCTLCPEGKSSPEGSTDCKTCPSGRYLLNEPAASTGVFKCKICPAGYYQPNPHLDYTLKCIECDGGYILDQGIVESEHINCTFCTAGKEFVTSSDACKTCSYSMYQNQTNLPHLKCQTCPANTYITDQHGESVAHDEYSDCIGCPSGKFAAAGQRVCDVCSGGKELIGTSCIECVRGQFSAVETNLKCEKCPRGYYQSRPGTPYCLPCLHGEFQFYRGKISCDPCPRNTKSSFANSTECQSCEAGQLSASGSAKCTNCEAGMFSDQVGKDCENCRAGRFRDYSMTPATSCSSCPVGKTSEEGSTKCRACDAGRFSDQVEADCQSCRAGRYRPNDMQDGTTCHNCPVGWSSINSSVKCILCEGGRFNSLAGQDCEDCDAGKYRPSSASASASAVVFCMDCPLGQISVKASVKCQSCDAGRFNSVTGTECADCVTGQHRPRKYNDGTDTAGTHCLACPRGYSSTEPGVTRCTPLPPGSYDVHRNGSIKKCEPGFTCAGVAVDREACLAGTYTSGVGSVSCVECPPGKFSPVNGASTCVSCPHGFFQSTPGNDECVPVEQGKIVATGGSASVTVPVGSKICSKTQAPNCDCEECALFAVCTIGTIGTVPPSEFCLACPAGFSSVSASVECQVCGKGKFSNVTGGACEECPVDTYQEQSLVPSLVCSHCPSGYNQIKKGAHLCLSKEWRYAKDCELYVQVLNDTAAERRDHECIPCPVGGNCTIHTKLTVLEPEDGYHRLTFDPYGFGACPVPAACSAKFVENDGCNKGHNSDASEMCVQCDLGYAAQGGRGQLCEKCPSWIVTVALLFGAVVLVIVLFAFLVWDNLAGGKAMIPRRVRNDFDDSWDEGDDKNGDEDAEMTSTQMPFHSIVIRAVSSYLQVAGLLLKFQLSLPPSVRALITVESTASSLSEPLLLFDCATNVRADSELFLLKQLASVWFIPLIAIVVLALFWLVVGTVCLQSKDELTMTGLDGFVSSLMILFYTLFPSVVNRIALTFSCEVYGYGAKQRRLLTESLSIVCGSTEHWAIVTAVGIPGILFFVIVIPTLLAVKLKSLRQKLKLYPSQKHYESKWTLRFGFMFAGYREKYEWWEAVVMLRKCCFVILAIFLRQYGAASQVVAASLVLIFALSAQLQNLPYQDKGHDMIEKFGIEACILQLMTALLCNLVQEESNGGSSVAAGQQLGKRSTAALIAVVFSTTALFFTITITLTIRGSQKEQGTVGAVARWCSSGCGGNGAVARWCGTTCGGEDDEEEMETDEEEEDDDEEQGMGRSGEHGKNRQRRTMTKILMAMAMEEEEEEEDNDDEDDKHRSPVRVIPKQHSSAHAALALKNKLRHTSHKKSRRRLLKDDKDADTKTTQSSATNSRTAGMFTNKRSWKANKVIAMNVASNIQEQSMVSIALRQRIIQDRKREAKQRLASRLNSRISKKTLKKTIVHVPMTTNVRRQTNRSEEQDHDALFAGFGSSSEEDEENGKI